jgi:hypothetical protein
MALAALAAIGALLFAGSGQANAAPQALKGFVQATSPVEPVGYYRRYRRAYVPDSYAPNYGTYSYRHYGNGHDEVRELQRLFPETNWPPSMRYHQY